LSTVLVGCSSGTKDVSISDTAAKEKQIEEASKKLDNEQRPQGQ
jgi:hypothetical protein